MQMNILAIIGEQTWGASGTQANSSLLEYAGLAGASLLALAFVIATVRAIARHKRYRAAKSFDIVDIEAVRLAIAAAEKKTVGEILPVVVERSDPHPGAPWISALVMLLTGSVLLAGYLPWDQPGWLLACQIALGAVGYSIARALPDLNRLFVSEERATAVASEQAFQEFYANGLHKTEAGTGVLLFVSLFERRVIVMGDTGINAVVKPEDWENTDKAILEGVRAGSLRSGLIKGVESAGALLAEHFPWTDGDRNEIPDRVIVRRE
ncbi:MAG: putative membrane protein [Planctomycetota bacterium]|jgi:putative membrane protein